MNFFARHLRKIDPNLPVLSWWWMPSPIFQSTYTALFPTCMYPQWPCRPAPLPFTTFSSSLTFLLPPPPLSCPLNKLASSPFPIHFPIHSYVSVLIYNFCTFPGNPYELRNINTILIDIFSIIFSLVSYMKKVIFVYCIYTCLCFGMSYFMVY